MLTVVVVNKMKKTNILLCLVLALVLAMGTFALVACGTHSDDDSTGSDSNSSDNNTDNNTDNDNTEDNSDNDSDADADANSELVGTYKYALSMPAGTINYYIIFGIDNSFVYGYTSLFGDKELAIGTYTVDSDVMTFPYGTDGETFDMALVDGDVVGMPYTGKGIATYDYTFVLAVE